MVPQEPAVSTYSLVPFLQAEPALLHVPCGWELADILDLDGVCGFLPQAQQPKLKG